MNEQRKIIYKQRDEVLDGDDMSDKIRSMIDSYISETVDKYMPEDETMRQPDEMRNKFFGWLCGQDEFRYTENQLADADVGQIKKDLKDRAAKIYSEKQTLFGDKLKEVERVILLRSVDSKWIEHLDAMDDLKGSIGLQAYAQRNPINEFRIASADMFDEMIDSIKEETVRNVLSAVPAAVIERKEVAKITGENFTDTSKAEKSRTVVDKRGGVAKNAPCPCGSGKKFKRCCGKDLFKDDRD